MDLHPHTSSEMEKFHIESAKHLQHLPTQCAGPGGLVSIGWQSIGSMVEIARLRFFWRTLLLPVTDMYKLLMIYKVFEALYSNFQTSGPTASIVRICRKYDLLDIVISSIETGDYMPIASWKKTVKYVIQQRDYQRLQITCSLYTSLKRVHFDIINKRVIDWWYLALHDPCYIKKCTAIVRLLFAPARLGSSLCQKCTCII